MTVPAPSLNQKLGAVALVVEREVDHVTASELAAWIVEGRSDYRLLDLRPEQDYAAYHVPTAENVPLAALPDYPLLRNEKIVLYSEGGIHSAQAWMLLRAQGYDAVYMVLGGLEAWQDEVLFPAVATDASAAERARFERAAALARFFGGQARTDGAATAPAATAELPRLAAPVATGPAVPAAPKKKKKEGC
ncbi:MAG: rhodanese-like domain-containing protein [Steroidobacteraceae bacterium]